MTRSDGVLRAPGTGISGRTAALVLAMVVALSAVVVISRQEGLPKQLIANLPGTRWLVFEPQGLAVLADAVTGRIVVQLDAAQINDKLVAVQGEGGAYLINRARGEAITIDEEDVRLDAGRAVPALVAESRSLVTGVGANGAVAASLTEHAGVLIPPSGPVSALELPEQADRAQVATDGTIWAVDSSTSTVYRQQGTSSDVFPSDAAASPNGDIDVTTVGTDAVVLDRSAGTVRWLPDNITVSLPSGARNGDAVLQQPGATAECVWIARADQLTCVGRSGAEQTVRLDSLVIERNDRLAFTTGYALLVRAGRRRGRRHPAQQRRHRAGPLHGDVTARRAAPVGGLHRHLARRPTGRDRRRRDRAGPEADQQDRRGRAEAGQGRQADRRGGRHSAVERRRHDRSRHRFDR